MPAILRLIVRSLYVRLRGVPYHVEVRDLYTLQSCSLSHEFLTVVEGGLLGLPIEDHVDPEAIVSLEDTVHASCEHLGPETRHREGIRPDHVIIGAEEFHHLRVWGAVCCQAAARALGMPGFAAQNV